jgi:hypothetical protein
LRREVPAATVRRPRSRWRSQVSRGLQPMEISHLRERAADIRDIGRRIIAHLADRGTPTRRSRPRRARRRRDAAVRHGRPRPARASAASSPSAASRPRTPRSWRARSASPR